jgi:hypothetical protein
MIGIAQPHLAQHFGWVAWIWVVVGTLAVYMVCWLSIRGYWRPADAVIQARPEPEPAAG